MRRWLGIALLPTSFVIIHVIGVLVGSVFPGQMDSFAYGFFSVVELAGAATVGVLMGRQQPIDAPWTLPLGVAAAMAPWLLLPRRGASIADAALGLTIWAVALTALGLATMALLQRERWAGVAGAVAGGIALSLAIPFLVVRMTLGADAAPWSSVAGWTPVGLVDYGFAFDVSRPDALQHASLPAVLVMLGTTYALAYVIGSHDRTRTAEPATV